MLTLAIKKSVPCNLRRIAACVTCRNRTTKTKIARYYNESDLLSTSLPNFATCRIYNTEPDSESQIFLPKLVDVSAPVPSLLTPFKLFYLSMFRINPYMDKDFNVPDFLKGARYATSMISKALTNKDYKSLEDLVTEDVIETLRVKIETLSPNQRQLITVNETDVIFYIISDIAATTGKENFIEITTTCAYVHNFAEKSKINLEKLSKSLDHLMCDYKFIRKYVDNVGGPWIVTFVNHYSRSLLFS